MSFFNHLAPNSLYHGVVSRILFFLLPIRADRFSLTDKTSSLLPIVPTVTTFLVLPNCFEPWEVRGYLHTISVFNARSGRMSQDQTFSYRCAGKNSRSVKISCNSTQQEFWAWQPNSTKYKNWSSVRSLSRTLLKWSQYEPPTVVREGRGFTWPPWKK